MYEIIDAPQDLGRYAEPLAAAGVKSVLRYYNHRNSTKLPSKALTRPELDALHAAGISVAVAFQQNGGANGALGDLTAATGRRDAERALAMAATMDQPEGSAIYFCVDWDYFRRSELDQIAAYFSAAKAAIGGRFRLGVYGSGAVSRRLKNDGLVDYVWLPGSLGWSGTRDFLTAGDWTLFQKLHDQTSDIGGIDYDANLFNPAFADFGQFGPAPAPAPVPATEPAAPVQPAPGGTVAMFEITARSGLNLRPGPGENYPPKRTLPLHMIVHGLGVEGNWIKVDIEGDGVADGFMSRDFLAAVSGGLPDPVATVLRPYDVARAELARNVAEFPGTANNNPRILLYHASTRGGAAPDETAWCSSFVNYCVEQAGMVGTDSKWARSWHDTHWGHEVTQEPVEGDIVVWRRYGSGTEGGHVAFFVDQTASAIRVLGGNQSNRICVQTYPKDGPFGSFRYKLLSIRRG